METNKKTYQAPKLEVYMIEVEQGFALSGDNIRSTSQILPENWEVEEF